MSGSDFLLDAAREKRIGLPEAIYCAGKTSAQIAAIIQAAPGSLLLTRLDQERLAGLGELADRLDYDAISRTAIFGGAAPLHGPARVAIVTAGTSDIQVAAEAIRTLAFSGHQAASFNDLGVAGLWRILRRVDELTAYDVVVVAAGMDAGLPRGVAGWGSGADSPVRTSVG